MQLSKLDPSDPRLEGLRVWNAENAPIRQQGTVRLNMPGYNSGDIWEIGIEWDSGNKSLITPRSPSKKYPWGDSSPDALNTVIVMTMADLDPEDNLDGIRVETAEGNLGTIAQAHTIDGYSLYDIEWDNGDREHLTANNGVWPEGVAKWGIVPACYTYGFRY